jgi:protein-disulfide isomerase
MIMRRAFTAALLLTGLVTLAGVSPLRLVVDAGAQSPADVARQVALPDIALGPADASVTIIEYASMTCPHCAHFNNDEFPKIKSEYIDTGKVRYVFREFPLDEIALAASTMARCVAKDDAPKYFALVDLLFKSQKDLVESPVATINRIGKQAGSSEAAIKACIDGDPTIKRKINAGLEYAGEKLKVGGTPTFFINGEMFKGPPEFDAFDKKIKSLLKS